MSLRTILFTIAATSLAAGAARAQTITPVSFAHEAEAFGRLDWTNPLTPDSIATDFDSGTDLGDSNAIALANNNGNTSVAARGQGQGGIVLNANGWNVLALSGMFGHSNLAAIADASGAATASMVFDLDQAAEVTLLCTFANVSGAPGLMSGESSILLSGPGGSTIFSFANPTSGPETLEFAELISLQPGQYTLTSTSFSSVVFPAGLTDINFLSIGLATISVPAPGGIALLALCGLARPRRRR